MSYPRNATTPERVAIGAVVLISTGAVQTSGVSVSVAKNGVSPAASGGTISYDQGIVYYVPTQAESNTTSFILTAYKTACIPATVNVVTTASEVPGYSGVDWSKVNAPTATVGLINTTIQLTATGLDNISQSAIGMIEIAKAVWDRVLTGVTHNINSSAGKRLRQIDAAFEVHSGTAQAGAANTITLDTGADATNDNIYRGDRCVIVDGTGVGEHGIAVAYVASTRVLTMSENWVVTPDATSEFILVPADVDMETWNHTKVTGDGDWALVQSDLDDIQARLPAALTGGRMNTNLQAIEGDTDRATRLFSALGGNVLVTVGSGSTVSNIVTSACSPAGVVGKPDQFKFKAMTFSLTTTTPELRGKSVDIIATTGAVLPQFTVSTSTPLPTAPVSGDTATLT